MRGLKISIRYQLCLLIFSKLIENLYSSGRVFRFCWMPSQIDRFPFGGDDGTLPQVSPAWWQKKWTEPIAQYLLFLGLGPWNQEAYSIWKFITECYSLFNFRMVFEQIFSFFEHGYAGRVDICNNSAFMIVV